VYATFTIAPGEDPEEFKKLHKDFIQEWQPDGATEEETVFGIATDTWRKRRVQKFMQAELFKNLANPEHPSYDQALALLYCAVTFELDHEADFAQTTRGLRADRIKYLRTKCPREDFKSADQWAEAFVKEIRSNLLPEAEMADTKMATLGRLVQSAGTLGGNSFKEELALEERLDAMIDRKIKRLLTLKATKPMLGLPPAIKRVHFPDAA
jgi:hypothetical protein